MIDHFKRQLDFLDNEESKMSLHTKAVFKAIHNLCKAYQRQLKIEEIINEPDPTRPR